MPAPYNMSAIEASNELGSMFTGINDLTGGLLGGLTLVTFFLILLIIISKRSGVNEAVFASSAASTVLGLLLLAGEFVNVFWVVAMSLIWGMSAIGLYLQNNQ